MGAGKYRHRIKIQQLSIAQDDIGNNIEAWTDFAEVWASAKSLSGREYWAAAQTQSEKSVIFEIRYRDGVHSVDMRVVYGTRVLDILSAIDPDERKKVLVLTCKEPDPA